LPLDIEDVIAVLLTGLGCPSENIGVSSHRLGERAPSKPYLGS